MNDMHGIPIRPGDLIRVKHYVHRRNRRQMWMYFRVASHPIGGDRLVLQNWNDLDASKWQCCLEAISQADIEVVAETWFDGETFNERPRNKPAV